MAIVRDYLPMFKSLHDRMSQIEEALERTEEHADERAETRNIGLLALAMIDIAGHVVLYVLLRS